ncbi:DUF4905 domain-containing protein [Mucilaginibacter terrae]|uniref:DUF4905 domain-containing protein n=1 Tax=Mucilaginibacter terrae TaxID=1955052 RepID=A0ABU3GSQ8_9SPHI|nr:DUF4905 domain-containing protein [Mucilaginibacter terrae]MDT3402516.1 hypothetical protein [Mucilaginibacter terrae]
MSEFKLLVAEHFNGEIWRMEVDHITHTLFAEIRNNADRRVCFAAISLKNGKTYFKNHTVDESWLTGIETAYDGVLLLHYYQTASGPTHKGLAAIDEETGNVLWHNFNYTFDQLTINGPVIYDSRLQPPSYQIIDIKTGSIQRKYNSVNDSITDNQIKVPEAMSLPLNFPKLPAAPYRNNIHYLEYNNWIIVSLHSLWAGQLKQCLYIIKDGTVVFEDILNTNIQKLQPEAFVLYQNQLIYLKDKVEIKVLNLS